MRGILTDFHLSRIMLYTYIIQYCHKLYCIVLQIQLNNSILQLVIIYVGRHSISIQCKLQVADVYNRINRLKEEVKLLHVEMKQFIIYFKETIPNRLKASIEGNKLNAYMYLHLFNCHNFAYSHSKRSVFHSRYT